ncbi:hypothetical protein ACTA71_002239 [Dictyostelium dimigraforme]
MDTEILIWKVFRNKYLFNKILNFLETYQDFRYNENLNYKRHIMPNRIKYKLLNNLEFLASKKLYPIIKDKIKSNSNLIITDQSILLIISNIPTINNSYENEVIKLFYGKYSKSNQLVSNTNFISLVTKSNNIELLKYFLEYSNNKIDINTLEISIRNNNLKFFKSFFKTIESTTTTEIITTNENNYQFENLHNCASEICNKDIEDFKINILKEASINFNFKEELLEFILSNKQLYSLNEYSKSIISYHNFIKINSLPIKLELLSMDLISKKLIESFKNISFDELKLQFILLANKKYGDINYLKNIYNKINDEKKLKLLFIEKYPFNLKNKLSNKIKYILTCEFYYQFDDIVPNIKLSNGSKINVLKELLTTTTTTTTTISKTSNIFLKTVEIRIIKFLKYYFNELNGNLIIWSEIKELIILLLENKEVTINFLNEISLECGGNIFKNKLILLNDHPIEIKPFEKYIWFYKMVKENSNKASLIMMNKSFENNIIFSDIDTLNHIIENPIINHYFIGSTFFYKFKTIECANHYYSKLPPPKSIIPTDDLISVYSFLYIESILNCDIETISKIGSIAFYIQPNNYFDYISTKTKTKTTTTTTATKTTITNNNYYFRKSFNDIKKLFKYYYDTNYKYLNSETFILLLELLNKSKSIIGDDDDGSGGSGGGGGGSNDDINFKELEINFNQFQNESKLLLLIYICKLNLPMIQLIVEYGKLSFNQLNLNDLKSILNNTPLLLSLSFPILIRSSFKLIDSIINPNNTFDASNDLYCGYLILRDYNFNNVLNVLKYLFSNEIVKKCCTATTTTTTTTNCKKIKSDINVLYLNTMDYLFNYLFKLLMISKGVPSLQCLVDIKTTLFEGNGIFIKETSFHTFYYLFYKSFKFGAFITNTKLISSYTSVFSALSELLFDSRRFESSKCISKYFNPQSLPLKLILELDFFNLLLKLSKLILSNLSQSIEYVSDINDFKLDCMNDNFIILIKWDEIKTILKIIEKKGNINNNNNNNNNDDDDNGFVIQKGGIRIGDEIITLLIPYVEFSDFKQLLPYLKYDKSSLIRYINVFQRFDLLELVPKYQ